MKYTLWFTGRPGAGKTTLANALYRSLEQPTMNFKKRDIFLLDGDELRRGLNKGLGFSIEDRTRNLTNAAHVCRMFNTAGLNVFATFVTPTNEMRDIVREVIGEGFKLVYVDSPLEVCIKRDPKGMYADAKAGKRPYFTGIDPSASFEIPEKPDFAIKTFVQAENSHYSQAKYLDASLEECVRKLSDYWIGLNIRNQSQ